MRGIRDKRLNSSLCIENGGFTFGKLLMGLLYMVGGIVGARIWCELLIVLFKMSEAFQEIRHKQDVCLAITSAGI